MNIDKTEKEYRQDLFRAGARKVSAKEHSDWKFYCFVFIKPNTEEVIDEAIVCDHVDRMRELLE